MQAEKARKIVKQVKFLITIAQTNIESKETRSQEINTKVYY